MTIGIIDTYELVGVTKSSEWLSSDEYQGYGQSILAVADYIELDSAKFFLLKYGSPTGAISCCLYNYTGVVGENAMPTGTPLGTSDPIDASSLTDIEAEYTFTFTGANRAVLTPGDYYIVTVEFSAGDSSNDIALSTYSIVHREGVRNASVYTTTWGWESDSGYRDIAYTIYGSTYTPPTRTRNFPLWI